MHSNNKKITMKQITRATSFSLLSFAASLFMNQPVMAERMTISDGQIPYFAMLKGTTSRNIIASNPSFCKQAPGPCRFFIESTHGHRHLNHLILPPKAYTMMDLKQADCYAVRNVSSQDIKDTLALLADPDEAAKYKIPGDLNERAANIRTCAEKLNK